MSTTPKLERQNAELLEAAKDALYCIEETWPQHANEPCDFAATETLCSRECEGCGCIRAKADKLRAAISKATE